MKDQPKPPEAPSAPAAPAQLAPEEQRDDPRARLLSHRAALLTMLNLTASAQEIAREIGGELKVSWTFNGTLEL
jgi:hypothetical protein